MKRALVVTILLTVPTAAYLAGRVKADKPGGAAARLPTTRIAFANIERIFVGYEKSRTYKAETEETLEAFRVRAAKLKEEIVNWQNESEIARPNPEQKKRWEEAIRKNELELQQLDRQARKMVDKKNQEHVCTLYTEIYDTIETHAKKHGFQAVLAFTQMKDPVSHASFCRMMRIKELGGPPPTLPFGIAPVYVEPGLDISADVIKTLNRARGKEAKRN